MRQPLGDYDDRNDDLGLVGEERADEFPRADRRLPMIALTVLAMAVFAGGLWFAYVQGTRHPAATAQRGGVPLIRADQHPAKVRPDQPGGMTIPDQNISLYNEKAGGPPVEKLLPAPEQPMPRPAPTARETPAPAPPAASSTAPSENPTAAIPPAPLPARASPAAKPAAGPARAKAATVTASSARIGKGTPVRVQLGAVRNPDAARAQWARLKREQPDLLGKLTAVAVRADLGDKGIFYRIEAGPLNDAAAADRLCGELKRRDLGCAVAR